MSFAFLGILYQTSCVSVCWEEDKAGVGGKGHVSSSFAKHLLIHRVCTLCVHAPKTHGLVLRPKSLFSSLKYNTKPPPVLDPLYLKTLENLAPADQIMSFVSLHSSACWLLPAFSISSLPSVFPFLVHIALFFLYLATVLNTIKHFRIT